MRRARTLQVGALVVLGAAVVLRLATALADEGAVRDTRPAMARRATVDGAATAIAAARGIGERPAVASWLAGIGVPRPAAWDVAAAATLTPGGLVGKNFAISDHAEAVSTSESLGVSAVAYGPSRNEYLVVWHAFDRVTWTNIYGQRVAANGALVGERFVICDAPGVQAAPSVSYEPLTGVYWVAWTDLRDGTADVRIRQVSRTGALMGSEIVANEGSADAFAARLACGVNFCAAVWASDPHQSSTQIVLRAWDATTLASYAFLGLADAGVYATAPDICFNPTDARFLVVWQQGIAGGYWDIWASHVTSGGQPLETKAVSTAVHHQRTPRVAFCGTAARYLVVWEDYRSGAGWDIYGQRLERGGALAGSAVAVFQGADADLSPVVAGHGGAKAEFLVAFARDISGASQFQIYACRVPGTGGAGSAFVVRLENNVRDDPAIVHRSGSDDYLVTFTDDPFMTQADIAAQVARGNNSLSGDMVVVSRGRKGQETPAVAYNALRDEYVAAWADFRSLVDYDIYYRRLSAAGAPLAGESSLASSNALYGDPAVAHNSTGDGYLVVWQEISSPESGFEIVGRRLSGTAAPLPGSILVSRDTNANNEGLARVAFNPVAGNYLVVWHAYTGDVWRIWGQRISAQGALLGSNFPISDGLGAAQNARIALNRAANEYLVVWQDYRNGRVDVFGQRLGATAGLLGGNLAIAAEPSDKNLCDVAYSLAANDFLVVWGDLSAGGGDVLAQRLDATGAPAGAPFAVVGTAVGEVTPAVAYDVRSHEYLVAYVALHEATDFDVWARRVPAVGLPTVPALPLSGKAEVQTDCDLVQNTGSAEFLAVWQDYRNGSYDIFGQLWANLPRARIHRNLGGPEAAP